MKKEIKTVVYDEDLCVEAYRFEGILQPFPRHFHDYYVIGFVEKGERSLFCKNQEYILHQGQAVVFHPGDSHACIQTDDGVLDYRGINITKEVMMDLAGEVAGDRKLPGFIQTVICDKDIADYLCSLHQLIMGRESEFVKEEKLLLLIDLLIHRYGYSFEKKISECPEEIEKACAFMEQHYMERICLDQICHCVNLSKSALLRAFAKAKGVTPYRYLENIRIGAARKLLEGGISPAEAALRTGFSDQSHFTNYFSRFIGLTPGAYREIFLKKTKAEERENES
ncbi:MAG: helix-turn-helix domain-containing protein [Ruminococcus sp.]|jgi:AraC-like DNA-binding protein